MSLPISHKQSFPTRLMAEIRPRLPSKNTAVITGLALMGIALAVTALFGYLHIIQGMNAVTQLSLLGGAAILGGAGLCKFLIERRHQQPLFSYGEHKPHKRNLMPGPELKKPVSFFDEAKNEVKLHSFAFVDLNRLRLTINGELINGPSLLDRNKRKSDVEISTEVLKKLYAYSKNDSELTERIEVMLHQYFLCDGQFMPGYNDLGPHYFDSKNGHLTNQTESQTNLEINDQTFKLTRESVFNLRAFNDPNGHAFYKVLQIVTGNNSDLKAGNYDRIDYTLLHSPLFSPLDLKNSIKVEIKDIRAVPKSELEASFQTAKSYRFKKLKA